MPENTMASFDKALELGADGIEFDVQLSRDGVPVVIHDSILDRTTSGSGFVHETGFDDIRALDAGSWFSLDSAPAQVPALDEVLESFAGRTRLNLELKCEGEVDALVKTVVEAVSRRGLLDAIVFSSFRFSALTLLREIAPVAKIGVLCRADQVASVWERAEQVGAVNIHPPAPLVNEAMVVEARRRGLEIWTWVANETGDIERLCSLGIEAVMSDYPDRVKKGVQEGGQVAAFDFS